MILPSAETVQCNEMGGRGWNVGNCASHSSRPACDFLANSASSNPRIVPLRPYPGSCWSRLQQLSPQNGALAVPRFQTTPPLCWTLRKPMPAPDPKLRGRTTSLQVLQLPASLQGERLREYINITQTGIRNIFRLCERRLRRRLHIVIIVFGAVPRPGRRLMLISHG